MKKTFFLAAAAAAFVALAPISVFAQGQGVKPTPKVQQESPAENWFCKHAGGDYTVGAVICLPNGGMRCTWKDSGQYTEFPKAGEMPKDRGPGQGTYWDAGGTVVGCLPPK